MPILDVNKLHLKSVAMHWNFFFLVVGIPKFLILAPPLDMADDAGDREHSIVRVRCLGDGL